jgi:hypothetical protein
MNNPILKLKVMDWNVTVNKEDGSIHMHSFSKTKLTQEDIVNIAAKIGKYLENEGFLDIEDDHHENND